jgi:N-methylhydantoinase A/oxoprolinase/acetone carboxylase beta subunit
MSNCSGLYLVGIDMGGTHIDGVLIKDGRVFRTIKRKVDRNDLFVTIWTTVKELLKDIEYSSIKRINLSTTVNTNAIVEGTTPPVGMLISSGPGMQNDFSHIKGIVRFLSGSIDHRGVEVEELHIGQLYKSLELFKQNNISHTAIVTKFSNRNPEHELSIKKMIEQDIQSVTVGHRMSGSLNFPRRVHTSYLNAAVHGSYQNFAFHMRTALEKEGIEAPVYMLKADGGTMDVESSLHHPVETILSGPSASVLGLMALTSIDQDALLLDIGGTTTDIFFLADGDPLFDSLGATIAEFRTLVRAFYSVSIGLGGDSAISVKNHQLIIGPMRKGAPYAYHGPEPTVTDAMIHLGLIEGVTFQEKLLAKEGITKISEQLNKTTEATSHLILNTMAKNIKNTAQTLLFEINSKPVYTVRELLHGKQIIPSSVHVIGGPATVLAPLLRKEFQLPTFVPPNYEVANAIGAALATPTIDITLLADTSIGKLTISEVGVYEDIDQDYSLEMAKERVTSLLRNSAIKMGADVKDIECEIIEESSFNIVRGFSTKGKHIRVKGQIRPRLLYRLTGGDTYES